MLAMTSFYTERINKKKKHKFDSQKWSLQLLVRLERLKPYNTSVA